MARVRQIVGGGANAKGPADGVSPAVDLRHHQRSREVLASGTVTIADGNGVGACETKPIRGAIAKLGMTLTPVQEPTAPNKANSRQTKVALTVFPKRAYAETGGLAHRENKANVAGGDCLGVSYTPMTSRPMGLSCKTKPIRGSRVGTLKSLSRAPCRRCDGQSASDMGLAHGEWANHWPAGPRGGRLNRRHLGVCSAAKWRRTASVKKLLTGSGRTTRVVGSFSHTPVTGGV